MLEAEKQAQQVIRRLQAQASELEAALAPLQGELDALQALQPPSAAAAKKKDPVVVV